jgi:hypothetical protein
MIRPHVASLQLIIKVYKISFYVGIFGNLILYYHLNSILETILAYTNIPTKQK